MGMAIDRLVSSAWKHPAGPSRCRVGADHEHLGVMVIGEGSHAAPDLAMIADGPQQVPACFESGRPNSVDISGHNLHCSIVGLQIERNLLDHIGFDDVEHLDGAVKE
jgi:hypothetical protein